jgi:hypothetical protein
MSPRFAAAIIDESRNIARELGKNNLMASRI